MRGGARNPGDARGRAARPRVIHVAIALCLMAPGITPSSAAANANRCGTSVPDEPPTAVNGFGSQWFNEHGVAAQAPPSDTFGYAGIAFNHQSAQVNAFNNNSTQIYLSGTVQCATVGGIGNAPNAGEYPIKAPPAIIRLPWLRRDGNLLEASDRRTTILRGFDYHYNTEWPDAEYNLTDADMARIASWGFNLLRIRIDGFLSGWGRGSRAEPGYWENLDHVIADANRHGIYAMLSTVTDSEEAAQADSKAMEEAKFAKGTAANAWWVRFEVTMFSRYRKWPGVVGYDTMNEDDSFPPPIIDRQFMGPAHEQLDAALRNQVRDSRHIYFQEPSGWSYWGAQFTRIPGPTGLMNGVDIGDPNRVFCPKWLANGDSSSDLATDGLMAAQSNAPLFICELWITKTGSDGTTIDQQRAALNAMDSRLVGGARYMYTPDASNGALTHDGHAAPWLPQYARPYPEWAGGTIKSIGYDFGARKLVVGLGLSGSGPTEVYVGYPGTYPNGFVASSSSGARLVYDGHRVVRASRMSWDTKRRRVVLPPQRQSVTFTLQPR